MIVGDFEACLGCLDDVVAFSDDCDDHLHSIEKPFDRLAHAQLTVNLAKLEVAIIDYRQGFLLRRH